uniref:Dolichyl-diphosphooligosaccharide--protein glycosyltransferase subunit 1 n=1 Tax=Kalanchoe fedtschenkoi TaxID=63787 RepID=A0A7N0UTV4_KALFE
MIHMPEFLSYLQTELVIEPRYPMFGGWRTSFTIGYGLPLEDLLFVSEGKRFLNITFGCPMNEVIIDRLVVKVSYFINISSAVFNTSNCYSWKSIYMRTYKCIFTCDRFIKDGQKTIWQIVIKSSPVGDLSSRRI